MNFAIGQQVFTSARVDQDMCRHIRSPGHNKFNEHGHIPINDTTLKTTRVWGPTMIQMVGLSSEDLFEGKYF